MYGDGLGERALAPLLRGRRSAVTVATKFGLQGWDWMGAVGAFSYPARAARSVMVSHGLVRWPKHDYSAAAMVRSLDISLSLMNTDYVDILFVHEPPDASFVVSGALRDALLEAKTAGKVRLLGVAGKTAVEVYARHAGLFDVLQAPADRFTSGMALMPDITYGIMRAVRGSLLAQDDTLATAALRNAFRDRPAGSVIVATTNLEHLNEYVVAAWALTR
jgi:aryl-alcohol dehydrogenase-like predicted oxidoreductase